MKRKPIRGMGAEAVKKQATDKISLMQEKTASGCADSLRRFDFPGRVSFRLAVFAHQIEIMQEMFTVRFAHSVDLMEQGHVGRPLGRWMGIILSLIHI